MLVTGGSGFIAGHCIIQLLQQGYEVRTTIRSLSREGQARAVLTDAGLVRGEALTFVPADLTADAGWAQALADVEHVLHVASPVHLGPVSDENDVIEPARDGTLRVLRAARDAGVKRVVLTSAFHAAGFGHGQIEHTFTEDDWSVPGGPGMDAYGRSKIFAERAAWDFITAEGGTTELTTMLPVAVMGPVMGTAITGANHIIQRILTGAMPGYPNAFIPIVDVRDVATAHIEAMTAPGAAGQRFLVATDQPAVAMKQIGAILRDRFGDQAPRIPTRTIPDAVLRATALVKPEFRSIAADLGYSKKVSTDKAHRLLGFQARLPQEAIIAAAESMIAKSLVEV